MMQMRDDFPGVCYPMMGLHPTSVKGEFMEELDMVEEWLEKGRFIAIGEIGIDLYWDKTYHDQQRRAFEHQLRLGLEYNFPWSFMPGNPSTRSSASSTGYGKKG